MYEKELCPEDDLCLSGSLRDQYFLSKPMKKPLKFSLTTLYTFLSMGIEQTHYIQNAHFDSDCSHYLQLECLVKIKK